MYILFIKTFFDVKLYLFIFVKYYGQKENIDFYWSWRIG